MTPAELTIAEVAERTGLTRHTLRYYERDGLMLDVSRDGLGAAGGGGEAPCPLHLPGPVVAQAEQADGALGDQLAERAGLHVQRNPGLVGNMRVVQVDPFHAEAFPAALACLPDRRG